MLNGSNAAWLLLPRLINQSMSAYISAIYSEASSLSASYSAPLRDLLLCTLSSYSNCLRTLRMINQVRPEYRVQSILVIHLTFLRVSPVYSNSGTFLANYLTTWPYLESHSTCGLFGRFPMHLLYGCTS